MPVSFGGAGATAKDIWEYATRILTSYACAKPSDTLRISNDSEKTTTSTDYVKVKETIVGVGGRIRVKFDLKSTPDEDTAYARIYVNGVAVGTQRTEQAGNYTTFSEDIDVDIGDLVQIYAKNSAGLTAYVKNFRIYFDYIGLGEGVI